MPWVHWVGKKAVAGTNRTMDFGLWRVGNTGGYWALNAGQDSGYARERCTGEMHEREGDAHRLTHRDSRTQQCLGKGKEEGDGM